MSLVECHWLRSISAIAAQGELLIGGPHIFTYRSRPTPLHIRLNPCYCAYRRPSTSIPSLLLRVPTGFYTTPHHTTPHPTPPHLKYLLITRTKIGILLPSSSSLDLADLSSSYPCTHRSESPCATTNASTRARQ